MGSECQSTEQKGKQKSEITKNKPVVHVVRQQVSVSFLYKGAQNWTQHSSCGAPSAEEDHSSGPAGYTLTTRAQESPMVFCVSKSAT